MGFMDIIRKIGNPFKGLLQLPRIVKRVEPEEFVYGYDLYTAMPDGLLGATPPIIDDWFGKSPEIPYPYDGVPQKEKTIHEKMYELSSQNLNIGGSETLT